MTNYYVDPRYLHIKDMEDETAPKLDFGQRVNRTVNTKGYYYCKRYCANQLPYSTPQYQQPELYFWADGDKLRVLGTDLELNMTRNWTARQQEKVANILGPTWSEEPLRAIYQYLCTLTFSEYYDALLSFKWAARVRAFPLFDQYERVQLIDGKLFGWLPPPKSNGMNASQYFLYLLTEETVGREIRRCGGRDEVGDRKKSRLTKQLVNLHQSDPYAEKNWPEGQTAVHYREGVLEYIPTLALARFSEEDASGILYPLSLGGVPKNLPCSATLEGVLLSLTGGDLDKLDTLAEFFARTFCSSAPSKHLWYIHGNSTKFFRWFYQLVEGKVDDTIYTSSRNRLEKYIVYDHSLRFSIQFNSCPMSSEQFAALNHSQFQRYIEGGELIDIEDPYQVEKTASYYPTVIFLAEGNTVEPDKAFKKLPWQEINVPDGWTAQGLSLEDYQWLKTCFVARGLQLVQGHEQIRVQSEQMDVEQVVRQFVGAFCAHIPEQRTDCKTFYNALKNYISTLPYEVELKGSTTTLHLVADWMGWERIEDRKNKNRKAFEGIRLDMDKLDAAIKENLAQREQEKHDRTVHGFHDYLTEITGLVLWS